MSEARPPLPPFTEETAIQKIRAAEDAWNTRDPERVSLAYTVDSQWRNRSEIFQGRPKIVEFLTRKWNRELDYRLIKELWRTRAIVSRSGSLTNTTTIRETGSAPTATRTGNSTRTA
jgi:nuclear transport factor 2 (NTF2) superfamily protein